MIPVGSSALWGLHMKRRTFLHLSAGAAVLSALSPRALAQSYPTRPVRIIVAFPAGGTSDIVARVIGQSLSERLGQQFVVENRPGAGGNIGTEAVVRAAPDGYTLLVASNANAANASLYDKLNFDFIADIAPVAGLIRVPNVVEVNPSLPVKTVPELIAYAKSNPVTMASAGNGTSQHIAGELFKMMTGVNMLHVPYRGSAPALTDLLGGQVQVMFDLMSTSIEYIRANKLRALAVTTSTRSEALPNLPTVSEFVPNYEASSWIGIGAPKSTPTSIVDRLNKGINAALADANVKARLVSLGAMPLSGSPSEFGKFIAEDTKKLAKVIKFANIKLE